MKKLIFLMSFSLLASCKSVEMPYDPEGTDEMRGSPCACAEIEYMPQTFEWVDVAA
ncbi:hypothetical protein [Polycladidibacter hongkongensis]|uniref:hypothetical protein n=1 Tax=Polycladidibacter hongkongensis TaxID=1647556 RepID=UPI000AB1724F|nr:hypothetical protein [Pseudovibrio hongkongensis]